MSKNNLSAGLVNLLYGMLSEIGGPDIEIQRDPLHARFSVNRYGLRVLAEGLAPETLGPNPLAESLGKVKSQLLRRLHERGWQDGDPTFGRSTVSNLKLHWKGNREILMIDGPVLLSNGKTVIDIFISVG